MRSEAKLSPEGLWQRFLTAVAPKLSAHVITNWLKPVRCSGYDGEVVHLEVRDEFFRHWLADHYGEFVREQLKELLGGPVSVVVSVVGPDATLARCPADVAPAGRNAAGALADPGQASHAAQAGDPELADPANDHADAGDAAQAGAASCSGDRLPTPIGAPRKTRRAARPAGERRKVSAGVPLPGQALELAAAEADETDLLLPPPTGPASPAKRSATAPSLAVAAAPAPKRPARSPRARGRSNGPELHAVMAVAPLNERYTFDSFVEGPSNQFASAACRAAADNPGRSYNPLFLFGGVGLGKTHLLCAIGHDIKRRNKAARVHYTSSEQFQSDVINAILSKRLEQFRAQYKADIDVLLMDDIQLISGKERTQHEFFQLFNAMFDSNRQIVVTSDKLPHEIPDIQERVRNRFQWGLIADVQPPEVETRIAILRKKAELEGFVLPNDVAFFLARAIRSNVRELEGALVRVCAQASLTHSPLTLDYVRASLIDIIQHAPADMTAELIQRAVCQFYTVRLSEMKGSGRRREVVRARQVAMFLCRKHLGASYPEIGARFGKKDHTTVLSACHRIAETQAKDALLRGQLVEIEQRIERPAD